MGWSGFLLISKGERPAAHPQKKDGRYDCSCHYDYGVDGCWTGSGLMGRDMRIFSGSDHLETGWMDAGRGWLDG
jgi:hypothetical protein